MSIFSFIITLLQFIIDFITLILDFFVNRKTTDNYRFQQSETNYPNSKNEFFDIPISCEKSTKIKLRLKCLFFILKTNKEGYKTIFASKLIIALSRYISKDDIIKLIYFWKYKNYVYWQGSLEPTTIIIILKRGDLIDSINSCKS